MTKNITIIITLLAILVSSTAAFALQVRIDILDIYEQVQAGSVLKFEVVLKDIEFVGRRDVTLDYYIRKDGDIITHAKEVKAVSTQTSFIGSVDIPEDTLAGLYTIEIVVDGKDTASDSFYVTASRIAQLEIYMILILITIITVGAVLWWEIRTYLRRVARRR